MNGEFTFHGDHERAISVQIQQLKLRLESAGSTASYSFFEGANSSQPIVSVIDSSRPYIFLPEQMCQRIARLLNLDYDTTTEHFLISNDNHLDLLSKNPSLEFRLASLGIQSENPALPSATINITLPYAFLALNLSFPILNPPGNSSLYFPIKIAKSIEQISLGRAFLQGVYLIANYERGKFALNHINWNKIKSISPRPISPIPILATDSWEPSYLCSNNKPYLNRMQTIGIGVGAGLLATIVILFFWLWWRRQTRKSDSNTMGKMLPHPFSGGYMSGTEPPSSSITPISNNAQLVVSGGSSNETSELSAESIIAEMPIAPSVPSIEIYTPPVELEAPLIGKSAIPPPYSDEAPGSLAIDASTTQSAIRVNTSLPEDQLSGSPTASTPLECYGRNARERLRPHAREISTTGQRRSR
jgi:hypothetical protein